MGVFEIGLVLSGGATMGSYTVGVLDFLLEALPELDVAMEKGVENVPPWAAKINNMSSTSAGSICTFLTAASVGPSYKPVPRDLKVNEQAPKENLLYRGWVEAEYKKLWGNTDLPASDENQEYGKVPQAVRSIFDSNYLTDLGQ